MTLEFFFDSNDIRVFKADGMIRYFLSLLSDKEKKTPLH
jgi:hypothetical protein